MSKSALYAVNTASQTLAQNGFVEFLQLVRQTGSSIRLSGGNAMTTEAGFYAVDVSLTFEAAAAETIVATLLVNGTPVPGATATITAAAAGEIGSITIPCIIRTYGCCMAAPSVISVEVNNAATITNASIEVVKL